MSSKLTGQGWVVEKDVVDERSPIARITASQIADLNTRIAGGAREFPTGTKVIRTDDEMVLVLQGVGNAAKFDTPPTSTALTALSDTVTALGGTVTALGITVGTNAQTVTDNAAAAASATAAALLVAQRAAPTGQFAHFMLPSAPVGWIAGDGATIGNVGSGATRANIDTLALFTAWWAYTDGQLPILTAAGGASTRGATAAADWAALKRLTVFDVRGRFVRNADGSGNINGTVQADALQGHTHQINVNNSTAGSTAYIAAPTFTPNGTAAVSPNNPAYAVTMEAAAMQSNGVNGAPRVANETRPINIAMLGCFKL